MHTNLSINAVLSLVGFGLLTKLLKLVATSLNLVCGWPHKQKPE